MANPVRVSQGEAGDRSALVALVLEVGLIPSSHDPVQLGVGQQPPRTLDQPGGRLIVTYSGAGHGVVMFEESSGRVLGRMPAGMGVCAPVLDATADALYVGLRFEDAVARFCLKSGLETGRVGVLREPVAAAVTMIETASLRVRAHLELPSGSVVLRGMAISPDGRTAVVTHNLARFEVPTTQVEHG